MLTRFPAHYSSPAELERLQLDGLRWTVNHAWRNSSFYRSRLEEAGVTPDDVTDLADVAKLPFTSADDLRDGYPFPLRAASHEQLVRIHSSSGTTGKRKILCYTQKDVDDWADMFCRCYEMAGVTREDRVQICVGYGLWTAGAGFQLGCERYGALAVPVGPGNLDIQTTFLVDLQSTVVCCTASMGLLLAEEVQRRDLRDKIAVRKVILGAERSSEAILAKIRECLGAESVHDITGLTEVYGPGTGLSCGAPGADGSIHYWADYYLLEILDPETLQPVQPGEVGEMVFTTLRKEGAPLIRYRSRDLTRLVPGDCPCGCILPRHDRILGRSDDVVIFRGVNIYPGQIDEILDRIDGLGSEFQVVLDRGADGRDHMTIRVERAEDAAPTADAGLCKAIVSGVKHSMMVSCEVDLLPYGELPRSERKTRRMFDNRAY
ncbi:MULTISPECIES: phenylacetate--CoA ligase [Geobacter]|uniref:phenylacetate--CoA ligase n=1 Tax=Geobacter TaxID=28231 RepID=UPI0025745D6B|nr:phenylacetate--CoA ligase [Geobacter sulfurreducens]BEH09954.1 phenylacetate--CoA ligase [Geobacter sulfurreducens subsp. ethanolicus]BET58457.1 phenylacetate--CoA ligase [Geobacter sp. 60473]HML77927.1 phenylacetate--CoA ligase [Geobacter sulfurreducens]